MRTYPCAFCRHFGEVTRRRMADATWFDASVVTACVAWDYILPELEYALPPAEERGCSSAWYLTSGKGEVEFVCYTSPRSRSSTANLVSLQTRPVPALSRLPTPLPRLVAAAHNDGVVGPTSASSQPDAKWQPPHAATERVRPAEANAA